jgi:hypothetical protein
MDNDLAGLAFAILTIGLKKEEDDGDDERRPSSGQ